MSMKKLARGLFIVCLFSLASATFAATTHTTPTNNGTSNGNSTGKPPSEFYQTYEPAPETPNFIAMLGDALVVRPIYFVATFLGTGAFILTIPFTIFTGSLDEEANMLIVTPFHETFTRCLGCETKIDKVMNE